ncbi:MAG TPA: efflux RND transporter permease subunit [Pirellulales bacterium]|jgi:multidrug efflux pump subunit AcrB|nr:efflux RND transporter permease subunit [Pirellulales bacterium]
MFNLAAKSRQYFGVMLLLTALVAGAGVVAMLRMPNSVYPEVTFPRIAVIAELPGTSIDLMEISVSRPLENAVSTVAGVERVQSTTIRGSSQLSVMFSADADMRSALESIRGRIATMSADLPKGTALIVEQQTPSVFPIITLDLSGGSSPAMLKDYATYSLRPLIKRLPDVAYVTILGGDEREIVVEPDPDALAAAGLSLDDFCQQLQSGNAIQAAGKIDWDHQALGILGQSISNTPDQIAQQVIAPKAGGKLRVDDLARVRLWHEDRTQAVSGMNRRREQTPVVSVSIFRRLGGNTLTVASALEEELKRLRPLVPPNIEMHIVYNQAQFVRESVANVRDAILIGGCGSVLVLLLFLRSWRATLISAVTIPVSIAITFLFLHGFNQSLNLMSMGGLAVAIGLIIDDTVVVIENICRHLSARATAHGGRGAHSGNVAHALLPLPLGEGRSEGPQESTGNPSHPSPLPEGEGTGRIAPHAKVVGRAGIDSAAAAVDAASREITGAVVGSTLTTVTVFVPLAFISGMVGQFFTSLSMALCIAVLVSMVLSLTLIPVVSARVLKPGSVPEPGKIFNWFANAYERVLRLALHWRKTVLVAALAVIPLMWLLYGRLESGLLPNMDEGTFILDYFMPEGTSLEETDRMAGKIEEILRENKYVAAYTRRTGAENGFFATQMFRGDFSVVLVDRADRPAINKIMDDVRKEVEHRYPAIQHVETIQVMQDELNDLAGAGKPIEIKIFGPDYAVLRSLAEKAGEILDSKEVKDAGLTDSDDKVHEGNADVFFKVDPVQAAAVGLSASQIQDQVRTALFGQVTNTVASGERLLNIRVRLSDALRSNLDRLGNLPISTPSGKVAPLEQFVTFSPRRTPTEVWRENQQPGIDVTGDMENADRLGAVVKAIQPKLAVLGKTLPAGYRIELAGEYESQLASFQSLATMLVVATALVFLLLAFQFRSLVLPLLIFLTQPLSLGSAMFALWITGTPLNISSYMGAILLVGLDVKNGIILIEYIEQLLAEGWQLMPALLHAGRVRFRPILMTSLAAILGLLPLALDIGVGPGGGPGAQMQRPLAIAVIGGLLANMLFTRMIIPVGYLVLKRPRETTELERTSPPDLAETAG